MNKITRYKKVIEWFEQNMPVANSELIYQNPYELIVARDFVCAMHGQENKYGYSPNF